MQSLMHVLSDFVKTADWVNGLLWLVLALVVVAGGICSLGKKNPLAIKEIHLHELSDLWTKEDNKIIHISELSPLWRDNRVAAIDEESLDLHNPRAAAFMENVQQWSWFDKFPQQKAICGQILKILDQEGHCPSVVNMQSDIEGSWDENTYRILAQTTLLDHSLNVAEQVVLLLSTIEAWHVIPDTMVAALAHDLGKLESMRGHLYSLGEHPLAAGRPLVGIPGFKDLLKKDEILRAIKLHHKKTDGLLGKTLKKADQLARQQELEEAVLQNTPQDQPKPCSVECVRGEVLSVEKMESPAIAESRSGVSKTSSAWQAQADIYGENGAIDQKMPMFEAPKLMDISGWFDAEAFLEELKPYINKMFGRRFLAFSMPDGLVYFQVKVLEEVARKQAERAGCMEIATMAQKDLTMRQVLYTVVHHLRVEQDVIVRGLIKDAFFGGYFTVSKTVGKRMKGYYTPFHAEAFGSIAEMEQAKPALLRDICKVSPFLDSTDSGDI